MKHLIDARHEKSSELTGKPIPLKKLLQWKALHVKPDEKEA